VRDHGARSVFPQLAPATFQDGAYFDFSPAPETDQHAVGSAQRADVLRASDNRTDADTQPASGGARTSACWTRSLPRRTPRSRCSQYPDSGQLSSFVLLERQADASHAIPIIKNEELILLDAEPSGSLARWR